MMNQRQRAQLIQKVLNRYFPDPEIPLKHTDPYTLLVAVLLSAQCTDKQVNLVTPLLFAKASTPEAMAQLPVEEIQRIIRPCGLSPRKSRAIWELSKILVEKHGGKVPVSFEALEALPGIGHKSASVVMSQAFQHPAFPVDTHIYRCARRWGLSNGKSVVQTEKDLKAFFPKKEWRRLHLQIIYFARKYCPAIKHVVLQCPICSQLQER